jgi:hypothetical protein
MHLYLIFFILCHVLNKKVDLGPYPFPTHPAWTNVLLKELASKVPMQILESILRSLKPLITSLA